MIPRLSKKCVVFLGNNPPLPPTLIWTHRMCLESLKNAQKFSNKPLLNFCWEYVDQLTMRVVKSNGFFGLGVYKTTT